MCRVRLRGRVLEVGRRIDAPAEEVWDVLVDTRRWPEWGPSIRRVECSDRRIRTGSAGRLWTVGGLELPFEITTCEDRHWSWRVAGVSATGHRVERLDRGCRVVFELPVIAAGYASVCCIALSRIARSVE
ncbi:SRPBCC family protein [Halalkalicoccus sp. GCM10025322]|uniref:SRPBCC family protein n=1 Tax=Halalkalicoccus TaxID=332246 RepID=UPI002F96570E